MNDVTVVPVNLYVGKTMTAVTAKLAKDRFVHQDVDQILAAQILCHATICVALIHAKIQRPVDQMPLVQFLTIKSDVLAWNLWWETQQSVANIQF